MSEYATESPVSLRRRRQRRRALITIGVVLLGLFFAFWYALSYYQNDARSAQPQIHFEGPAGCDRRGPPRQDLSQSLRVERLLPVHTRTPAGIF